MIVPFDAKKRTIVSSFVLTKHRNVVDGQTERQTELVWLLQRSALRAVRTRCKKRMRCSAHICHVNYLLQWIL